VVAAVKEINGKADHKPNGTILATIKIENMQRYREDLWLGREDSNLRMAESKTGINHGKSSP
jgi:hypothetical protein